MGRRDIDKDALYPAVTKRDNLITVGAYNGYDLVCYHSNSGIDAVDVTGPGTSLLSTYLYHSYTSMEGTIPAAAHVAGIAGLALSVNPRLSAKELRNLLVTMVEYSSSIIPFFGTGGRANAGLILQGL